MIFLQPWAWWFLAGVPLIVLLYLRKVRRRPQTVSSLVFWRRTLGEQKQRALFQRLRQWLSLLLHLLIFLLILVALLRPERKVAGVKADAKRSTVLVLDARARMLAKDGAETRADRALREAGALINTAGQEHAISIVAAGAEPEVLVPFTTDQRVLAKVLSEFQPGKSTGRMEDAARLAEDMLGVRAGDHRVVVLDGVPRATENRALSKFAVRTQAANRTTVDVFFQIRHFGAQPAKGNLEIMLNNQLVTVHAFSLAPEGQTDGVISFNPALPPGTTGTLSARLDKSDALEADNTASVELKAPRRLRVLLVTEENWFLEKVLGSSSGIDMELLAPGAFNTSLVSAFDALVFDRFVPAAFDPARPFAPVLFVGESPFVSGTARLGNPPITDQTAQHPLLQGVDMSRVRVLDAATISLPEGFDEVLGSFRSPLLVAGESGGKRVAATAFNVDASDFPLRTGFPVFMANTMEWLAGETADHIGRAETIPEAESGAVTASAAPALLVGGATVAAFAGFDWRILVLAAFLLLLVEWWCSHRRLLE